MSIATRLLRNAKNASDLFNNAHFPNPGLVSHTVDNYTVCNGEKFENHTFTFKDSTLFIEVNALPQPRHNPSVYLKLISASALSKDDFLKRIFSTSTKIGKQKPDSDLVAS